MTPPAAMPDEVAAYRHGRVPREVRERQILGAADELFAEHGFAGASMDELARRVGVSKPVIYALVGSKEELYRRCVERLADALATRVAAAAADADEPRRRLSAGLLAFFGFVAERRRQWEALALDRGPFAADAAAIRRRQDELVAALFADAARRQGVRPDARRVRATAEAVNGAVEALARWWRDHDDVTPEELARWAVELLFPGLQQLLIAGPAAWSAAGS